MPSVIIHTRSCTVTCAAGDTASDSSAPRSQECWHPSRANHPCIVLSCDRCACWRQLRQRDSECCRTHVIHRPCPQSHGQRHHRAMLAGSVASFSSQYSRMMSFVTDAHVGDICGSGFPSVADSASCTVSARRRHGQLHRRMLAGDVGTRHRRFSLVHHAVRNLHACGEHMRQRLGEGC